MKVILIDPLLKDQSGHQFLYASEIQAELDQRGIGSFILGNALATTACEGLKNFYPIFDDIVSEVFDTKTTVPIPNPITLCASIAKFKQQLKASLLYNGHFQLERGDVVFFHTLYIFEFFATGLFFFRHRKLFEKHPLKIILPFNFPFRRNSFLLTLFLKTMYRVICNVLLAQLKGRILFGTAAEIMRQDYEKLLNIHVSLLPTPIYPFSSDEKNKERISSKRKIVVTYLGAARFNKGFDILAHALEFIFTQKEMQNAIEFVVQVDIQKQLKADKLAVQEAAALFEKLARQWPSLILIKGTLTMAHYYELLEKSGIVILPYRKETFRTAVSNVFIEAVVAGKVPIVADDTFMAEELKKYGLKDLIFDLEDISSVAQAIRIAASGIDKFQEGLKPLKEGYARFHSAKNLVDIILAP